MGWRGAGPGSAITLLVTWVVVAAAAPSPRTKGPGAGPDVLSPAPPELGLCRPCRGAWSWTVIPLFTDEEPPGVC